MSARRGDDDIACTRCKSGPLIGPLHWCSAWRSRYDCVRRYRSTARTGALKSRPAPERRTQTRRHSRLAAGFAAGRMLRGGRRQLPLLVERSHREITLLSALTATGTIAAGVVVAAALLRLIDVLASRRQLRLSAHRSERRTRHGPACTTNSAIRTSRRARPGWIQISPGRSCVAPARPCRNKQMEVDEARLCHRRQAGTPRRLIQRDRARVLPPRGRELLELTDGLVNDETRALRIAGMDGATVHGATACCAPKNSTSGRYSATPGAGTIAPLRRWNICG